MVLCWGSLGAGPKVPSIRPCISVAHVWSEGEQDNRDESIMSGQFVCSGRVGIHSVVQGRFSQRHRQQQIQEKPPTSLESIYILQC